MLKKWLTRNRRHTFRKIGNYGTKSCTQAAGKNDRFFEHTLDC